MTRDRKHPTIRVLGLSALLLSCSTGVAAQKAQTVETAKEFLERTSAQNSLSFGYTSEFPKRNSRTRVGFLPSSERCRSELAGSEDAEVYYGPAVGWHHLQGPLPTQHVTWSEVRNVEQRSRTVVLNWSRHSYHFDYPTAELAARAAFAMEFLRIECDPTADLAF